MLDLTLPFIISQVAITIAMVFDFLSLQYKKREYTFLCLIVSASLISAHYFLLGKIAAGVIVLISVLRFITCYFTTNKKYLFIFIALNTISLFFTYKNPTDLIIYVGLIIFIIGNFQEDNKLMRKLMMSGTSLIVLYNAIILSPMGVVAEGSFLISGFIGYYRFYIKNKEKIKKSQVI
ncbi:MAG: YgjV family protein [Candidatus Buchananbacteria bacterium]